MGHEITKGKMRRRCSGKRCTQRRRRLLDRLGANIDPQGQHGYAFRFTGNSLWGNCPPALSSQARIIIMDEPTAALTKRESEELYEYTEKLREGGASIIFISHRFEDMYRLADRVTVLRDAQYIGTWDVDAISNEDMIIPMVGREIKQLFPKRKIEIGENLRVEKTWPYRIFQRYFF